MTIAVSALRRVTGTLAVTALGSLSLGAVSALAASPSDDRAEFHDGNVTQCDEIDGVPEDHVQVSGLGANGAGDANVEGTVDDGKRLNVEITSDGEDAGVVIDAVVVKGSDGYNVYQSPFVPPEAEPPQNYISPLNNGGNVPDISHWFVCYHIDEPPPPDRKGDLVVLKEVVHPDGTPVEPLPESYTVTVICTGAGFDEEFILTFGAGGGFPNEGSLTGLPGGVVCTVEENVSGFPEEAEVSYSPPEAATTGVTIEEGSVVFVTVTNDFSGVDLLTGEVEVTKVVSTSGPVDVPDSFSVSITCSDGTSEEITFPGDGGVGSPVVEVTTGADCIVEESSLPDDWTVTYSVDGSAPAAEPASFVVEPETTTEVTVTNSATATAAPTSPAPSPTLPSTGISPSASTALVLGIGALGLGALALLGGSAMTSRR